jgi:hypothetical protein
MTDDNKLKIIDDYIDNCSEDIKPLLRKSYLSWDEAHTVAELSENRLRELQTFETNPFPMQEKKNPPHGQAVHLNTKKVILWMIKRDSLNDQINNTTPRSEESSNGPENQNPTEDPAPDSPNPETDKPAGSRQKTSDESSNKEFYGILKANWKRPGVIYTEGMAFLRARDDYRLFWAAILWSSFLAYLLYKHLQ